MEILKFTLKLNAPWLPSQTKQTHKDYDHFKEQGKKAFHCKVAKELVPFFHFLGGYAHCLWLEVKYFGKFAKVTKTLANNTPLSDCTKLHQCMQGHLNFHLSSTSLTERQFGCNGDPMQHSQQLHDCQSYTLRDALPSETQEWIPTVPSAYPVSIRGG